MKTKLLLAGLLFGTFITAKAQVIYSNDFTTAGTGTSALSVIDGDGDTKNWGLFTGSATTDAWGLSGNFAGSKSWDSTAGALTPNNFLLTPGIAIPESFNPTTLSFVVGASDTSFFAEHIAVYLAPATVTTAAGIAALDPVFEMTLAAGNARTAIMQNIDVSEYAGQTVRIVMRHFNCTDQNLLYFDTLSLSQAPLATTSFASSNFAVYPNPANDVVNIASKSNGAITAIAVTDLNGRIVKQAAFDNMSRVNVNIGDLAAGAYLLNITSKEGSATQKIIKK